MFGVKPHDKPKSTKGIYCLEKLSFHDHTTITISKTNCILGLIKRSFMFLDTVNPQLPDPPCTFPF